MWFIYDLILNRIVWRFVKICELMLDISSTLLLSTSLHLSEYWRMAKAKVSSVDLAHPGLEEWESVTFCRLVTVSQENHIFQDPILTRI